jgi:hypothetical protein
MSKIITVVILISSVVSFVPLYYFTLDYTSYLYWENHQRQCNCAEGSNGCSCGINTGLICNDSYENHNYVSFHDVCTIHRFDGECGIVQFTSIVIGIIPVLTSIGLLSTRYMRHRTEIKK